MNTPDKLIAADSIDEANELSKDELTWIVRLEQRDNEFSYRFVDYNGNVNARIASAMLLTKEEAKQFAKAITDAHPKYKARAFLFSTLRRRKRDERKLKVQQGDNSNGEDKQSIH